MSTENEKKKAKKSGLIARIKQFYDDRPAAFAVGVICLSAVLFVLGGVMTGDIDLSSVFQAPMNGVSP